VNDLATLKQHLAEALQRRDAVQAQLSQHHAEVRRLRAAIKAIEHPPRPPRERGLKPDDDLSFLWQPGRTRWPKDKEARRAEKRRRTRIAYALDWAVEHITWADGEDYDDYCERRREFKRNTPLAELIRLEREARGLEV
jgi:hypothetical protein